MSIPLKICSMCTLELPVEDFNKAKDQKSGLRSECRECRKRVERKRRRENKEQIALNMRKHKLKWSFGITPDDYEKMYKNQRGCCAICNRNRSDFKIALSVDHDHKTGKVRGLLCHDCNTGLGKFKDSIKMLNTACDYLIGGVLLSQSL